MLDFDEIAACWLGPQKHREEIWLGKQKETSQNRFIYVIAFAHRSACYLIYGNPHTPLTI
jgi:hypothetical protein